jgi:hypothetical protein
MFAALAYNFGNMKDKLTSFSACAPIVDLKHTTNGMISNAASLWHQLEPAASFFNLYEIKDPKYDSFMKGFCKAFGGVCSGISNFLNLGSSTYNVDAREDVIDYRP